MDTFISKLALIAQFFMGKLKIVCSINIACGKLSGYDAVVSYLIKIEGDIMNNNKVDLIDEIFEISEVEKGDVNSVVARQGCISVQTPNVSESKEEDAAN